MTCEEETNRRPWLIGTAVAAVLLVAACSTGGPNRTDSARGEPVAQTEPYGPYLVGQSYRINGTWYEPEEDFAYDQVGMASWYGSRFHGRRTANGETFDMNRLTAAHPSLPMPTLVRVTNLSNGRWVVVRINDRGPFAENRIIDLSREAAERIGMVRDGVVRVRVRVLREESVYLRRLAEEGRPTHRIAARMVARANAGERTVMTAARQTERDSNGGADRRRTPESEPVDISERRRETETARTERAVVESEPVYRAEPRARERDTPVRQTERARAESEVIATDATVSASSAAPGPRIFVQAGAFSERENAERAGDALSHIGRVHVTPVRIRDTLYYRVRVGPVGGAEAGDELLARVVRSGYPNARIVVVD